MKNNFRNFDKSFLSNIVRLSSSAFSSQLLNLGFTWIAARYLFNASDFGNQALFLTYSSFLAIIASFKLELGIVLQADDESARRLLRSGLLMSFVFSICLLLIFAIFCLTGFSNLLKMDPIWLLMVPLSVFLLSATQLCWMWYTHLNDFKVLSVSRIVEIIAFILIALLFYFFGLKKYSLLFATVLSQTVLFIFLYLKTKLKNTFSWHESWQTLVANKRIPLNNIFLSFYDILQNNPINLIGPLFFTVADIGYYNFGIRFLQIPLWLIFKPLSNVFLKDIANHKDNIETLRVKSASLLKILLPFSLLFIISCYLFGPYIFKVIFGNEWEISGVYFGFFAVYYGIDFIRISVSYVSLVLNKQHLISYISAILVPVIVIGFYFIAKNEQMSLHNKLLGIALLQAFSSILVLIFIFRKIVR